MPLPAPRLALLLSIALVVVACSSEAATPTANAPSAAPSLTPTAAPTVAPTGQGEARAPGAGKTAFKGGLTGDSAIEPATEALDVDAKPAPELVGLLNSDGSSFDLGGLEGSPSLLFFGYTHCPDVCPATIGELFGVFEERPDVQAVFVSVDPERDTPEFLDEWTQYFPENFNAVTGTPGAIRRAADNYGVKYARVETSSTAGYTMSHTADVYLIDGEGRLLLSYPFGTSAESMVADLSRLETG